MVDDSNIQLIMLFFSQPLTIEYPDGFEVSYGYNSIGQPNEVSIQEPGGVEQQIIDNVSYSPLGQMSVINYTNGTISTSTFDINQAYRLTQKETTGTSTLQDITYTYDNVGNITRIVNNVTHQLAKTSDFVYDGLYRLTFATTTDDYLATTTVSSFAYDIIGNIINKSDIGDYEYGNDNPYQASEINSQSYAYDDNGNLTNDGIRAMLYLTVLTD